MGPNCRSALFSDKNPCGRYNTLTTSDAHGAAFRPKRGAYGLYTRKERVLMQIFAAVKAAVTTREAAVFYGLRVPANGMICCPFHPDRHPSMKVDAR